jgi:hypothetical protein
MIKRFAGRRPALGGKLNRCSIAQGDRFFFSGAETKPFGELPELLLFSAHEFAHAARPDNQWPEAEREGGDDGGFDDAPRAALESPSATAKAGENGLGKLVGAIGGIDHDRVGSEGVG